MLSKRGSFVRAAGFFLALILLTTAATAAPQTYSCDPGHTEIVFRYNHSGFAPQTGGFSEFTCTLTIDESDIGASSLKVTIKAASLTTGFGLLDADLKGTNFFDAAKFPEITFVSTSIKRKGRKGASVAGNLTIKGITQPVTLKVKMTKKGEHPAGQVLDAFKGKWIGFTADAKLKRSDFKIDQMVPLISDKVTLSIATQMKAQ